MSTYAIHHRAKLISNFQEISKPDKDPKNRICFRCNKPGANKWDGGMGESCIVINGKEERLPTPLYICDKCDPHNMWFEITD